MASLQARHSRSCPVCPGRTESLANAQGRACGCRLGVWVDSIVNGEKKRVPVDDIKKAQERLQEAQVDTRRGTYDPPRAVRFENFADEWLESLRRRSTTADNYGITLAFAKRAFGHKYVSKLTVSDVRKMLELVEREYHDRQKPREGQKPHEVSPTTLAKHLRQLSTCLEAAVADGLLSVNPCKRLPKSQRPKVRRRLPAYFTDGELKRLWPELESRPVYLTACKLAATTGLRQGELAGLLWSDVDLLAGELHLRRQFTGGELVDHPKDSDERVIDLVPAARELLERWWVETGDDGLVLELETGGYLDASNTRKVLYAAMKRAGIPRVGERGGTRDFHSFRHTFARVALENGAQLEWVQSQLGHSSISLTRDTYGHWSRQAEKREAERLEGAFTV